MAIYAPGTVRRVLLVFLALAALTPSFAMAAAWYRCQLDGEVRQDCCCPASEPSPAPALEATRCCEVTITHASAPGGWSMGPPEASPAPPPLVSIVLVRPALEPPARIAEAAVDVRSQAPPGAAPLFVRLCSLLR